MPYVYESTASGVSDKTYNIWQKYNTDINVSLRVYKKAIKQPEKDLSVTKTNIIKAPLMNYSLKSSVYWVSRFDLLTRKDGLQKGVETIHYFSS